MANEFSSCKACHNNIEAVSDNHNFKCIDCHSGNNKKRTKEEAHRGMECKNNPSDIECWDKTCGKCHYYQYKR
ncbi:MAG: cytochrome C, partial [Deferribacterota bacterium]|nr:cytochrome C [Deferribacterota bacterium]